MDELEEVRALARAGERVRAIQLLQKTSDCTIHQAISFVDAVALGRNPRIAFKMKQVAPSPASVPEVRTPGNRFRQQIAAMPLGQQLLALKEIAELPTIIGADENLLDIVQGVYKENFGVLVTTEQRLVFVDKGMLYGLRVEDFPMDKISSIVDETGLFFGTIRIIASGNRAEISNVPKSRARTFTDGVRSRLRQQKSGGAVTERSSSVLDQLERLADLRDRGVLTDKEFETQKRRIMGQD